MGFPDLFIASFWDIQFSTELSRCHGEGIFNFIYTENYSIFNISSMLSLCDNASTARVAVCVSVSICVCVHLTHELQACESKGHVPEKPFIAAAR